MTPGLNVLLDEGAAADGEGDAKEGGALGEVAVNDGAVEFESTCALGAAESKETRGEVAFEVDAIGSEENAIGEVALVAGSVGFGVAVALDAAEGKIRGALVKDGAFAPAGHHLILRGGKAPAGHVRKPHERCHESRCQGSHPPASRMRCRPRRGASSCEVPLGLGC